MSDQAEAEVEARRCLVISDGRRGIENQALGLAESCAALRPLTLQTYHLSHSAATAAMPPKAQLRFVNFDLPACDIAIGCGRQAVAPLIKLKRMRPEVMTVYVQDPRMDTDAFDLVIAPEHDGLSGPNVETMIGSPNRVTQMKIIVETLNYAEGLKKLPMRRAALLIGGTSKTHKLDKASHLVHLHTAKRLIAAEHSVLVTTSRRTPDFAVLEWKRFASDTDNVWLHEGDGPNPYFAFLGGADMILVTEDSTNMLTEACATGKAVFRLPMAGDPGKFQILYDALEQRCGVRRHEGELRGLDYPPLDETGRMAQIVWERFDQRADGLT